jgi:hypothetical protein
MLGIGAGSPTIPEMVLAGLEPAPSEAGVPGLAGQSPLAGVVRGPPPLGHLLPAGDRSVSTFPCRPHSTRAQAGPGTPGISCR